MGVENFHSLEGCNGWEILLDQFVYCTISGYDRKELMCTGILMETFTIQNHRLLGEIGNHVH